MTKFTIWKDLNFGFLGLHVEKYQTLNQNSCNRRSVRKHVTKVKAWLTWTDFSWPSNETTGSCWNRDFGFKSHKTPVHNWHKSQEPLFLQDKLGVNERRTYLLPSYFILFHHIHSYSISSWSRLRLMKVNEKLCSKSWSQSLSLCLSASETAGVAMTGPSTPQHSCQGGKTSAGNWEIILQAFHKGTSSNFSKVLV